MDAAATSPTLLWLCTKQVFTFNLPRTQYSNRLVHLYSVSASMNWTEHPPKHTASAWHSQPPYNGKCSYYCFIWPFMSIACLETIEPNLITGFVVFYFVTSANAEKCKTKRKNTWYICEGLSKDRHMKTEFHLFHFQQHLKKTFRILIVFPWSKTKCTFTVDCLFTNKTI